MQTIELFDTYLAGVTEALENLKQIVSSENTKAVIEKVKALKPNFAKLYKLFGDEILLSDETK
jgi:hypothetical protein